MKRIESLWRRSVLAAGMSTCALAAGAFGQTLPVDPNELVHTLTAINDLDPSPEIDDPVVLLFNVNNPAGQGAIQDQNWSAGRFWNNGAGPDEWTARNLGNVFGVCLDRAANPNIYVSAANYSVMNFAQNQSVAFGPGGPGAVYRLDGTTGQICLVAQLTNTGPGLGDVAHGVRGNVLYVSNFEDGNIYRVPLPVACPQQPFRPALPLNPQLVWDHGMGALSASVPDDELDGLTSLRRRVWGLAVNEAESRLYYGTWLEDSAAPNVSTNNQIWSVALDASGQFIAGSAVLEATTPTLSTFSQSQTFTAPIADVTFGPTGNLFIAERSVSSVHYSRVLELSGASGGWTFQPQNKWRIGRYPAPFQTPDGQNSTGGVGVDCDGNVWAVGDALILDQQGAVYGLHRVNAGGNAADSSPTVNGFLIDSDNETTFGDKTFLGSLTLRRDNCQNCGTIREERIICKQPGPDGTPCYTYTFTLTNLSGQTVNQINIASPLVSPNPIIFNPPLANNASQTITLTICGPAGGTSIDLPFILFNQQGQLCCNFRHRVTLPDCACFTFEGGQPPSVECTGPGQFNVQFFLQPTSYGIGHIFISPTGVPPGSTTVTPSYIAQNIPLWGAGNVSFSVNSTLAPGTQICFTIVVHKPDFSECCSKDVCVTVPDCRPGTDPCDIDFNNNGVFPEDQDVTDFFNVLAGGPCSTLTCDSIDFNGNGVFPEDQDVMDFFAVLAGAPCP